MNNYKIFSINDFFERKKRHKVYLKVKQKNVF